MEDDDRDWWAIAGEPLPETVALQDASKLNIGLRYLWAELRRAESEFSAGRHLDGAYLSLVAVIAFLSLFHPARVEGLPAPLMALESALWSLDEGITQPILKPVRRAKSGRARSSIAHQELKGAAVYVVHRLYDLGLARTEALKIVGADLRRIGVKPDRGSGEITSRTVRGWCDEVAADIGRHGTAARRYYSLLSHPGDKALEDMPSETARLWLRSRLRFFVIAISGKPANPLS